MKKLIAALLLLTSEISKMVGKATGTFITALTEKKFKVQTVTLKAKSDEEFQIINAEWEVITKGNKETGEGYVITTLLKQGNNGDKGVATVTLTLKTWTTASFESQKGDVKPVATLEPTVSENAENENGNTEVKVTTNTEVGVTA